MADFISVLVLAVGLSMDAAAASASRGLGAESLRASHFARVALYFGGSQALMPLLGWWLGAVLGPWMAAWAHWVACGLLCLLGAKMIRDGRAGHQDADEAGTASAFDARVMLMLAFATSLDAFAVGITLPMLGASLVPSVLTIGLTTAFIATCALGLGHRFRRHLGSHLDVLGGVILIVLGIKIVIEAT